ncbi:MAG: TerC family protein [Raoultibacter sp.]
MDLSIFATPEAWISLITLIFLEIVLGVDNIVFIAITTNRLPEEKQHIGRKLGLAGALIMRIVFLCFASYLIHMTAPLFDINLGSFSHGFSVRDIVLLLGGGYLIYKGISELRSVLGLTEEKAAHGSDEHKKLHQLMLPQAIGTIMVMDLVFSIDSVITAVGLADHLIIMILAVMIAVVLMMVFIDPISKFINGHPEMKILALCFIVVIGILLFLDSLGINSGIEVLHMHAEKLMVYFAMVFAFALELIQMAYNSNLLAWKKDRWKQDTASQIDRVKQEMLERFEAEQAEHKENASTQEVSPVARITPVFIGSNVYIMMPVENEDADSFRQLAAAQGAMPMQPTIEIEGELVEEASEDDAKPANSESKGA